MRSYYTSVLFLIFFTGCAGMQRGCSSACATSLGADWIILQYGANGEPINCWKLHGVSVANEENTDGIHWLENTGHLVHISGWYNRVQVQGGDYEGAAKSIGIDLSKCTSGKYLH